jgi:hypothetical protein
MRKEKLHGICASPNKSLLVEIVKANIMYMAAVHCEGSSVLAPVLYVCLTDSRLFRLHDEVNLGYQDKGIQEYQRRHSTELSHV